MPSIKKNYLLIEQWSKALHYLEAANSSLL